MHVSSTARRYGRALASVAISKGIESHVGEELSGLAMFLRDNVAARLVLESPASSAAQQERLLAAIEAAVELTAQTKNFLHVLLEERRFALFEEIVEGYRREVDRHHGVVEVAVATAHPLGDEERDTLRSTLQDTLAEGREVRLDLTVDPSLIAGTVIRIGSVVHDGSLVHQLNHLRQQLIAE